MDQLPLPSRIQNLNPVELRPSRAVTRTLPLRHVGSPLKFTNGVETFCFYSDGRDILGNVCCLIHIIVKCLIFISAWIVLQNQFALKCACENLTEHSVSRLSVSSLVHARGCLSLIGVHFDNPKNETIDTISVLMLA